MPLSRDVVATRFAAVVRRALRDARDRGLSDMEIEKTTGVSSSTFHRWGRGDLGKNGPQPSKVQGFFTALGLPVKPALDALGWTPDSTRAEPEPDIPPEVRELLRRLRDPNVPDTEKFLISETVKSLIARRPTRTAR